MLKLLLQKLRLLLNLKRPFPTSQDAFEADVSEFLLLSGVGDSDETRALFGTFVQHSSEQQDYYRPRDMKARLRKAFATRCAFYLIHPSRKPKDGPDVVQSAPEKVVSEA